LGVDAGAGECGSLDRETERAGCVTNESARIREGERWCKEANDELAEEGAAQAGRDGSFYPRFVEDMDTHGDADRAQGVDLAADKGLRRLLSVQDVNQVVRFHQRHSEYLGRDAIASFAGPVYR
jgi:hypothetical protein